jgi:hypothetical protein
MNRHDRVLAVVLTAEHLFCFTSVHLRCELVEPASEVVCDRLAARGPLHEHGQVLRTAPERVRQIAVFFESPAAL